MRMTKTITRLWMLIALLFVALTGHAQMKVSLMDDHITDGLVKSENSFTGSNIKEVKNGSSSGKSTKDYTATVVPGQTISAECTGSYTVGKNPKECQINITISFYKYDGPKPIELPGSVAKESKSKPLSVSATVPAGATKATLEISCTNGTWRGAQGTLVHVDYDVKQKETTASPISGTMERLGMKMAYSCSEGVVTQKSSPVLTDSMMTVSIFGEVKAGATLKLACKGTVGEMVFSNNENFSTSYLLTPFIPIQRIRYYAGADDAKGKEHEVKGNKPQSHSITIPKGASYVRVDMDYRIWTGGMYLTLRCRMKLSVVEKYSKSAKSNFNDVAEDNVCPECKAKFSGYFVGYGFRDGDYIVCGNGSKHRKKPFGHCLAPIYLNDKVVCKDSRTSLTVNQLGNVSWYRMSLSGTAVCRKKPFYFTANDSIYTIVGTHYDNKRYKVDGIHFYITGRMAFYRDGRYGSYWSKDKPNFERQLKKSVNGAERYVVCMSNCTVEPIGTQYIVQDDGKNSQVYLLDGTVITSNSAGKSYALQPGQASSVGKDGKIKLKKFDAKKVAGKYGFKINTETSSATTVQKRYAMQRGTIKYKYAKGKQTGEIIRTFDSYGHYERVASKIKGSSATSLNIYRGEKAYKVDTKAKTVTQSKYEAINFLNITEAELSKHKLKKKGTATVAGKQCVVYGNANEDYYVWQGITLKKVINSKDGKIVSEAVSITQPAKIDANKFKVPSNYKMK